MQNLYRHFDENGNLLYVGISLNAINRLSQHKQSSPWFKEITKVTVEHFDNRKEALEAEKTAIYKENPIYNIHRYIPKEIKEFEKQQELENLKIKFNESRKHLLKKIVTFDPIYTIDQAASILKVGVPQVKKWIEDGKIGYFIKRKYFSKRFNKQLSLKIITG